MEGVDAQSLKRFFYELKVTGNLKTFNQIMVSLKFHDKIIYRRFIEINAYSNDSISITIIEDDEDEKRIVLDKSTAIKLSKELRKQIALLD